MPIVNIPEFEACKAQGYKGTFVGGCIERGDGSSFRRKAHAHNYHKDPHFGWICVRSAKRLYTRPGQPSNLMWHEMSHIVTPNHGHDDVWRAKAREMGVHLGKRYEKKARATKEGKTMAAKVSMAEKVNMGKIAIEITGDPQAKLMGIAKAGGQWYKNYSTGMLYRIDKNEKGEHVVAEKKQTALPAVMIKAQAKKQAFLKKVAANSPSNAKAAKETVKEPIVAGTMTLGELKATIAKAEHSRAGMMERVQALGYKYFRILNKAELAEIISYGAQPSAEAEKKIAKIIEAAKKRWQNCPFFQKKAAKVEKKG